MWQHGYSEYLSHFPFFSFAYISIYMASSWFAAPVHSAWTRSKGARYRTSITEQFHFYKWIFNFTNFSTQLESGPSSLSFMNTFFMNHFCTASTTSSASSSYLVRLRCLISWKTAWPSATNSAQSASQTTRLVPIPCNPGQSCGHGPGLSLHGHGCFPPTHHLFWIYSRHCIRTTMYQVGR